MRKTKAILCATILSLSFILGTVQQTKAEITELDLTEEVDDQSILEVLEEVWNDVLVLIGIEEEEDIMQRYGKPSHNGWAEDPERCW